MQTLISLGYFGLFIAAFLAGSFVPFSSEVVLAALLLKTDMNIWSLLWVATAGNWLGEMTCYLIGRAGKLEWIERWTRVSKESIDKWKGRIKRYGGWLTFFSFVPGLGNVLAVAAGYFRCPVWICSLMMLLGKLIRYLAILAAYGLLS